MGHRQRTTADRNREIFTASELGGSVEQLSESYGLTVFTIREIIRQEGHRRALSGETYYQRLRQTRRP